MERRRRGLTLDVQDDMMNAADMNQTDWVKGQQDWVKHLFKGSKTTFITGFKKRAS